ncbi:MAG: hypothetical protein RJA63_1658 [Pseudomonadota bacterium]|jgi:hypothetical protein
MNEPSAKLGSIQILAMTLILLGLALLVGVLAEIYTSYIELGSNPFVTRLSAQLASQPVAQLGSDSRLTLGEPGALYCALILFMLGVWVSASIAIALIRAGVQVLSPDVGRQLAALKRQISLIARAELNATASVETFDGP